MNRVCRNFACPNGGHIITMAFRGTEFCCENCEKATRVQPGPKPPVKKRSARKSIKKNAGAKT